MNSLINHVFSASRWNISAYNEEVIHTGHVIVRTGETSNVFEILVGDLLKFGISEYSGRYYTKIMFKINCYYCFYNGIIVELPISILAMYNPRILL